jgi:hypothetical protein
MVDKKYTEDEIRELLEGYLMVDETLFESLPPGAHIRYFRKNKHKEKKPFLERFRMGGFVNRHYSENGKKFLILESKIAGVEGQNGYVKYNVCYDDIDELWKKYDQSAYIEILLINSSLVDKKKKIEKLESEMTSLRKELDELKAIVSRFKNKK